MIASRVLSLTGVTRLAHCERELWGDSHKTSRYSGVTHYPSTPAAKACFLSSAVARPLRAKILHRCCMTFSPAGLSPVLIESSRRRSDSTLRIARVASIPSMTGIDKSMRTMLNADYTSAWPVQMQTSPFRAHSQCPGAASEKASTLI